MIKNKLKECTSCGKEKPVWKRFKNQPYCKTCAFKKEREIKKEKRKKKQERITFTKLQPLCNRLIKEIFPLVCHACYTPLEKGTLNHQACHCVAVKEGAITRFDPRNILPGCGSCNGFKPSHVYELGKNINKYWGEGTVEHLRELSRQTYKWSQPQLRELKELFTHPPEGKDMKETRQLILEQYLKIRR